MGVAGCLSVFLVFVVGTLFFWVLGVLLAVLCVGGRGEQRDGGGRRAACTSGGRRRGGSGSGGAAAHRCRRRRRRPHFNTVDIGATTAGAGE